MLNNVNLMGRLCADPELRYTQSQTPVATFRLAVDEDYTPQGQERKTNFISIVAWRGMGEFAAKYFKKGSMAIVTGRLQMRDYTDKNGEKRTAAEVVADHLYFGEARAKDSGAGSAIHETDDADELPF